MSDDAPLKGGSSEPTSQAIGNAGIRGCRSGFGADPSKPLARALGARMRNDVKPRHWYERWQGQIAGVTTVIAAIAGLLTAGDGLRQTVGGWFSGHSASPTVVASFAPSTKPFAPVPFSGKGLVYNADNNKYLVFVLYRQERQEDAELIVGALLFAGYQCQHVVSTLEEAVASDKRPDTTLIKTTSLARPIVDDVSKVVGFAIPLKAAFVAVFPGDAPLQRGNIQIDLF
jgi:hypothetical protein